MKECINCKIVFEEKKSFEKYCSLKCCRIFHNTVRQQRKINDPEYRIELNRYEQERRKNGGRNKKKHADKEKERYRTKNGILSDLDLKCAPKGSGCLTKYGYRKIHRKGHPNAWKNGDMFEHVFIMSEHLKRPLRDKETVHHKNGIKHDNRIENLELWSNSHPYGQRVEDKVKWCKEFLMSYGYDILEKKENGSQCDQRNIYETT